MAFNEVLFIDRAEAEQVLVRVVGQRLKQETFHNVSSARVK